MTASDFGHLSRRYPLGLPNEPVVLYQGPAVLNDQQLDVTVEFGWQPTPGVRILVDDLPHLTSWELGFTLGAGDKTLHLPGLGSSLPVAVERSPPLVLRMSEPVTMVGDTTASVSTVTFYVVNLSLDPCPPLSMQAGDWLLDLEPVPDLKEIQDRLDRTGGYAVTHLAALRHRDGSAIDLDQAREGLAATMALLTFARGAWATPLARRGFRPPGAGHLARVGRATPGRVVPPARMARPTTCSPPYSCG